ncbi:MAG: 3-methyl-2-oxobutanoate hydroxymethyltransferase [Defluviitaleaceae bacterium]|nr:3-methyl-2-oxobutanoate hydroxymethyltransferase [Defluviitaleaceae bacterium]
MKKTVSTFLEAKGKRKLSMLTAYDYSMAKLIDEAGIDSILVGDSLGMVIQGQENTLSVTIEDMIYHTKLVSRGVKNALVIADMPFMSYQTSVYDAVSNAGKLIKEGGAVAVKLEGGIEFLEEIKTIVRASIPVAGHIGLTPQSINALGGFKAQGKNEKVARKLIEEAKKIEQAGAFCIVVECVPEELTKIITETVNIPIIGIGAGKYVDGQVLVYQDMLGMFSDFTPKFVKRYANTGNIIKEAIETYIKETSEGSFPSKEHTFKIDKELIERLKIENN